MKRRGNCYVTCESLYHLLGGKDAGYVPHTLRHEGDVHWYLIKRIPIGMCHGTGDTMYLGTIIDPTVGQFKEPPDYTRGRARGFLTKTPSKRAREMMDRMVWSGEASAPKVTQGAHTYVAPAPRKRVAPKR